MFRLSVFRLQTNLIPGRTPMEITVEVHEDHQPTNVETRPMVTDLGEFDAFAESWIEFGGNGPRRRHAVLLGHRRSGATRRGDDLSSALGRPVAWREAMPFIRLSLEPLADQYRRILHAQGACAVGEAELGPIVAERHRAHLLWIGKRIGGPLGELFGAAARKGYAPVLEPDTFLLHPIDRPDHVVFRGWYDASDFSASLEMAASLPEIAFATTAHETIAARSIRRRAGDGGLELGPVEEAPVHRETRKENRVAVPGAAA
jgi:hypothetical protein